MKKEKKPASATQLSLFNEENYVLYRPRLNPKNSKSVTGCEADLFKNSKSVRDFDADLFEKLCLVNCTLQEIEFILDTRSLTLNKWCERYYGKSLQEVYQRLTANGKASLRRIQFKLAHTNAPMAIWLGKQWLNQKDHPVESQGISPELKEFVSLIKNKYSANFGERKECKN